MSNDAAIGIVVIALVILMILVGMALPALYYGVIIALIYKFLEWIGILAIGML